MKYLRIIVVSLVVALLLVGVTNQFTTSKYPPCDLVLKGTGVSTFGCSNSASTVSYACKNESPNSAAMKNCINANYYKYKTFPFGYKQSFGDKSNLNDSKPKMQNAIATFILAFLLSAFLLTLIQAVRTKRKLKSASIL